MKSGIPVGAILVLSMQACVSAPALSSFEQRKQSQSRALTISCYRHHEGLRIVHGDAEMFVACRRWAEARVR